MTPNQEEPPARFLHPKTRYAVLSGWAKENTPGFSGKRWHVWIKTPTGQTHPACRRRPARPRRFVNNVIGQQCARCSRYLEGRSPSYLVAIDPLQNHETPCPE